MLRDSAVFGRVPQSELYYVHGRGANQLSLTLTPKVMTTSQALNLLQSMDLNEIEDALQLQPDCLTTDLVADEIYSLALACLLDSDNL